jgi:hypothetical protein
VNYWRQFCANGTSPDGTIHTAANGYPEIQVFPCPANTPGSSGPTPNDISYLLNNSLLPVAMGSPKQWPQSGQQSSASKIGVPSLMPLFIPASAPAGMQALSTGTTYQAASGAGNNATYAIVGFVGVCISEAGGADISVQPRAVLDPTAVIPNPKPVGTQTSQFGTIITTFVSAKLTQ